MCSTGRPSARFDSLDVTAPSDAPHLVLFRLFFFGPCVSSSFVTRTPFNVVDVDKRIRGRRKPISLFWSSSSTQRHRDRGGYLLSFQLFCLDPRSFSVLQCLRWWPLRDNIIHWGQKEKKKTLVNWESLRNITGKNSLSSLKKCLPKAEKQKNTGLRAFSPRWGVSLYNQTMANKHSEKKNRLSLPPSTVWRSAIVQIPKGTQKKRSNMHFN